MLRTRRLQLASLLLCAFAPIATLQADTVPMPPTNLCIDSQNCGGGARKWNPGHYMQVLRGDNDARQSTRFSYYDAIARNTAIVGVAVPFRWAQLESSKGDYSAGIALVRNEINYLKNLAVPKRLIIRMNDHDYGGSCPSTSHIPQYISSEGGTFQTRNGCNWRRWNEKFMGYYIDMLEAYARAFDDEPYFEGVVVLRESPLSWGGSTPPADYSDSAYLAQLNRLMSSATSAFKSSLVVSPTSYVAGTQSNTNTHISHVKGVSGAAGNMDSCPSCNMWADLTLRGSSGGVDYRGQIPIVYSVESSELGENTVGPDGGFTPSEIGTWANNTQKISHLMWDRNTFTGTSAQRWDTGILPYINNNPLRNTACPSAYPGCSN